ncbi:MAG: hypothetical protein ABSH07_13030 [Candidatus Dormibacteria bacterium]|jgi:hypothetical protein
MRALTITYRVSDRDAPEQPYARITSEDGGKTWRDDDGSPCDPEQAVVELIAEAEVEGSGYVAGLAWRDRQR